MHRVRMLIYFGVTPYLVFDGDNLPSKAYTESKRAKRREESKKRGMELYKARKVSQAWPELQKSIDVTPYMARQLIEALKKLNVQYVVAPYEADAQLAYLEKKGIIDGIVSEDSDLLVYGAKRLITKLDQHGNCIEIRRSDFASCRDMTLAGFTDKDFRVMAILSGCDYLANINKIGLKTAHAYVRKYKHIDKILRMLQTEQKFVVPSGYLEQFHEAERTFLHHRVFCPLEKKLVFSTGLDDDVNEEDMPYLGRSISPTTAIGVACGDLNPMTKEQITVNIATSARSMPDLVRRRTIASAVDLKSSKSIDNFFKAKRQPLAELDPNSLTPSPSQQRLLDFHRNASWEPRPVASAPQLRSSASILPDPGHMQPNQSQSRERSCFLERAATLSTFKPPKRTRLCSDVDVSPSGHDVRSPFFAEPSPSTRKRGKTKQARLSDIEILSDDSVADRIPDLQDPKATPVKISTALVDQLDRSERIIIKESTVIATPVTEVCDTPTRQKTHNPPSRAPQGTSAISVKANDNTEEFQDLVESHVERLNNLRHTFAYQSSDRQAAVFRELSPINDNSQRTQQVGWEVNEPLMKDDMLGNDQTVARHSQSQRTPSLQKTFGTQSPHQQGAAPKPVRQVQNPEQKVKLGLAALDSATHLQMQQRSPTPGQRLEKRTSQISRIPKRFSGGSSKTCLIPVGVPGGAAAEREPPTNKALEISAQGSEDLLLPKSEDEASEVSEIDGVKPMKHRTDLGRFAFISNA